MLALDSPRWSELHHAHGTASDIPQLLRRLESLPDSLGNTEPWSSLWSALAHQGDVYSASFAAVPHVVRILATAPDKACGSYFQFPAWVEICRQRKMVPIPPDLLAAYTEAFARLPELVAVASKRVWDADFLASALSAIAAAKQFPKVAEATMELTPEVAEAFLNWQAEKQR